MNTHTAASALRRALSAALALVLTLTACVTALPALAEDDPAAGLTNVALGKRATQSINSRSGMADRRHPADALDGDPGTYWDAGYSPASMTVDLGQEYEIRAFRVTTPSGGGRYYQYEISVSADNKSFTAAAAKTDTTPADADGDLFLLDTPVTARFVTVKMTRGSSGDLVHISELEVLAFVPEDTSKTALSLNRAEVYMNTGDVCTLTPAALDENGQPAEADVKWTSADPSVCTVDGKGQIKGVGAGMTTVTASADKLGRTAECAVFVFADGSDVRNVALNKPVTASVEANGTKAERANDGNLDNYWDGGVAPNSFTIDLEVPTVIRSFRAYPVTAGRWYSYTIAVSTDGYAFTQVVKKDDTVEETDAGNVHELMSPVVARYVKVTMTGSSSYNWIHMREFEVLGGGGMTHPEPSLTFGSRHVLLPAGETSVPAVFGADKWGDPITGLTFSSSDEGVASVDGTGRVTAKAPGTAEITVTGGGVSAVCTVEVSAADDVTVKKLYRNVALGKTVIDEENGSRVFDITDGDYADYWNGGSAPASVVLDLGETVPVEELVLTCPSGSYTYEIFTSTDGVTYTLFVSKRSHAAESAKGTSYKPETPAAARYVRVNMLSNKNGSDLHISEIEVYTTAYFRAEASYITVSKPSLTMPLGAETPLSAVVTDEWRNTVDETATWTSADPAVASVSEAGQVRAVGFGRTTLTVRSAATGAEAVVDVTVFNPSKVSDRIGIMAFWPPTAEYCTDEQYDLLAEAHFNQIIGTAGRDLSGNAIVKKVAALCAARGMEFIPGVEHIAYSPNPTGAGVAEAMDKYQYLSGIGGFLLVDEPMYANSYANCVKAVRRAWPDAYVYLNMLPYIDAYGGYENYEHMIADYINDCEACAEYIMFDRYPFGPNVGSFDAAGMFTNMNCFRKLGLEYGVKTSMFLQSVGMANSHKPDKDELRFEIAIGLAYGFKQLAYFTYFSPSGTAESFSAAIMDGVGNKSETYDHVKELNAEIDNLSPVLVRCEAVEVYHTGVTDGQDKLPENWLVRPDGKQNLLLSHLTDAGNGLDYLMVVNKKLKASQTVTLTFADDVVSLREVSRADGSITDMPLTDHTVTLDFIAGEGRLFQLVKADTGVNTVVLSYWINEAECAYTADYTAAAYAALSDAAGAGRAILTDPAGKTQADVEAAVAAVRAALADTGTPQESGETDTQPEVESATEPAAQDTQPAAESGTQASDANTDSESDTQPAPGGCSSAFASAAVLTTLCAAAAASHKKKKESD